MVHAEDQPELFRPVCEVFERLGFSIPDAQIYTRPKGWVLDTFVVQPGLVIMEDQQGSLLLEHALKASLLNLKHQQHKARTTTFNHHDARSAQARVFPLNPRAELRHLYDSSWELSILGTDRKGLLFSLAQCFAQNELNLRSAKVMTLGERVEDNFILESSILEKNYILSALIRDILRLLT